MQQVFIQFLEYLHKKLRSAAKQVESLPVSSLDNVFKTHKRERETIIMMKMARMMPMMVIMMPMPMPMTMAILWTNLSANRVSQPGLFIVNVATKEVQARTLPDRSFLIILFPSSPMYYHIKAYLYHPHKRSASQNPPCRSFLDCHCHDCNDNSLILMLFGPGVYLVTS